MAVALTNPIIIPPSNEVVYDKVWFPIIRIIALDPNEDARVQVEWVPYRELENGQKEIKKDAQQSMSIDNLFERSEYKLEQIAGLQKILSEATVSQLLGLAQFTIFAALEAYMKLPPETIESELV